MIEELVPTTAQAEERFTDPDGPISPYPAEQAVVARAVEKRRREFGTVRLCARTALARLAVPAAPILPGPRGAPGWPAGIVGSMTHCAGYRAAVVARQRDITTIGIDAEPHEPLPSGVLDTVASDEERAALSRLAAQQPSICWDRLLFCVKEAVYKAWFPLTGRWLGFEEAAVQISPANASPANGSTAGDSPANGSTAGDSPANGSTANGSTGGGGFAARLLVPPPVVSGRPLFGFEGRWLVRRGLILTAIVVSRESGEEHAGVAAAGIGAQVAGDQRPARRVRGEPQVR